MIACDSTSSFEAIPVSKKQLTLHSHAPDSLQWLTKTPLKHSLIIWSCLPLSYLASAKVIETRLKDGLLVQSWKHKCQPKDHPPHMRTAF